MSITWVSFERRLCVHCRKRKVTRSRRGVPEEEGEGEELGGRAEKEEEKELKKAKEKARIDDLWASFKQDTATVHKKHSKAR